MSSRLTENGSEPIGHPQRRGRSAKAKNMTSKKDAGAGPGREKEGKGNRAKKLPRRENKIQSRGKHLRDLIDRVKQFISEGEAIWESSKGFRRP